MLGWQLFRSFPKWAPIFFSSSAAKSIRNRLNFLRIGNLKAPPSRKEILSLAALSIEQNVSLLILTLDSQAPVYTRAVFVLLAPLVSSAIEMSPDPDILDKQIVKLGYIYPQNETVLDIIEQILAKQIEKQNSQFWCNMVVK